MRARGWRILLAYVMATKKIMEMATGVNARRCLFSAGLQADPASLDMALQGKQG